MQVKRIVPKPKTYRSYLIDLWNHRGLIISFAKRDLKVQFAQTFLGLLWSAIQPLTGLLIFTFFFDKLIQFDTLDIPYPLFAFTGIVGWYYFTYLIGHAGTSLTNARDLINKVYFPKLVLPLAKTIVGFVEFGISFLLLFVLMMIMGYYPDEKILLLPFFILLNIITGLSLGLWLAALTIQYRDFHHIIPYLVNFGIWITPVFYPTTLIPQSMDYLIYMNPMAGVIAGYRWVLLNDLAPSLKYLYGFIPVVILLLSGFIYFKKIEQVVADYL